MTANLPVLMPRPPGQKFQCAGCTRCCRELIVHLFPADRERIDRQNWAERLGQAPYVALGGSLVLNKSADGACVFLDESGKCRIHAEHGLQAKPIACQLYPFTLRRSERVWQVGLRFDCPTVARSRGEPLTSHEPDVQRLARAITSYTETRDSRIELQKGIVASDVEVACVMERFAASARLAQHAAELETQLRVAAFVVEMLSRARLQKVRGQRFVELVHLLFDGAPMEIESFPDEPASPSSRKLLRQLAYTLTESVSLDVMQSGTMRKAKRIMQQWRASARFRKGRGRVPQLQDDNPVSFEQVEAIGPAGEADAELISDLISRYLCARLQSGNVAGNAYYGWTLFDGLQALFLSVAAISWLARLQAARNGHARLVFEDFVFAVGCADRAAGRSPSLGTAPERLRTRHLTTHGELQRLFTSYPIIR